MAEIIQHPFGVETFGSAVVQAVPDVAQIRCSVTSLCDTPREAFSNAKTAALAVRNYLSGMPVDDVTQSRQRLSQEFAKDKLLGYQASIVFHIRVCDLAAVEEILSGVVDQGVNRVDDVEYQSTELATHRRRARVLAVEAATRKAEVCCDAAGVVLGAVLHIQDLRPETYVRRTFHATGRSIDPLELVEGAEPGSIPVAAAVRMAFAINSGQQPDAR